MGAPCVVRLPYQRAKRLLTVPSKTSQPDVQTTAEGIDTDTKRRVTIGQTEPAGQRINSVATFQAHVLSPRDMRRKRPLLLSFLLRLHTLRRVARVISLLAIDYVGVA